MHHSGRCSSEKTVGQGTSLWASNGRILISFQTLHVIFVVLASAFMPCLRNSPRNFCFHRFALLALTVSVVQISCGTHHVTVCTYNLWNVMFSWEIRMQYIANMVNQAGCDVLLLQEVRIHGDRSWSQALFLQRLLPKFQWAFTRLADKVTKPSDSYWTGWEGEGLAVLSKLRTGEVRAEHLSKPQYGSDANQRIALHVPIILDSTAIMNIVVVHFSYQRQQQCQNALEVLKFIQLRLFLDKDRKSEDDLEECSMRMMGAFEAPAQAFHDAWEMTHKTSSGFTFSNMPSPGLTSRPDRILVTNDITVEETQLHGDGTQYKSRHSRDILFHRFWRVLHVARDTFQGGTGFSCLHDCGPHGACRCGVCMNNEAFDRCLLPDCSECSSGVYLLACAFSVIFFLLLVLAVIAAIKILVVASRMDQSDAFFLLGCTCCLCNPKLIRQSTMTGRHWTGRLLRCLGVGKLSPVYLLLFCLIVMVLCLTVGFAVLKSSFDMVGGVMPEEYFPSDHLMLAAELEIH
ncbi:uncharacterized protein [Littorina saxatilis]|uniref:uncharacterized protein isoform X2 n=1 Tax=Littorina saxatilis TaxID=31220 RepID=UPI0038B53241